MRFAERIFAEVEKALGSRRVIAGTPPGRVAQVSDDEPDEGIPRGAPDDSSAWSAFITYTRADGEESCRTITFRSLSGHYGEPELIRAFCQSRESYRTFRVDRIGEMACAVTGEELDPLEQCRALARSGALKIEDKALTNLMRLLIFMARCDGEFHPLETSALEEMFGRYCLRFGGDDAVIEQAMKETPRLAPDADDVLRALKAFARMPDGPRICRFALESSGVIIDADGRHAPEEIEWAIEVSSALKAIAGRN